MMELLIFIGHQFSRTKTFREGAIKIAAESKADDTMSQTMMHAWWFISYMLGMNLGSSLYGRIETSTHTLLINNTDKPFITADQPVLNVHPCVSETEFVPPKMVDFYYPISPKVAFIACESKRFDSGVHSADVALAEELNTKVSAQALVHIIGDSKSAIDPYKKIVGRRYRKNF